MLSWTNHPELIGNGPGGMIPRAEQWFEWGQHGRTILIPELRVNCPGGMIPNGQKWFEWVWHEQTILKSGKTVRN